MVFQFGSMQNYAVGKIDMLITQHAKQIILYDPETKTINWRFITNEILNVNRISQTVYGVLVWIHAK